MSLHDQDVNRLLELARDKSVESRQALVETISAVFTDDGAALSERERALIFDILSKLVHDFERRVRRELSERMASRGNAAREIVVLLANDDIEVARPILLLSDVLEDADLIEIVRHRTAQHQLAIAMRREVSEAVSDALVETGEVDVIKALLENPSASISQATMVYLVEQSRRVDTYQDPLVRRHDLSPALAKRMCLWVSAALRSFILDHYEIDPTELDDLLEEVALHEGGNLPGFDEPKDDAASSLAQRIAEEGKLTPEFLVQILRQGEIPLFEAAFAQMTGLRRRLIQRLAYEPGGEGLVICCRALGVDKPVFTSIFLMSRKGRPGDQLVDPAELSRVLALFDRVKPEAATTVLRRWRRDPDYLYAIKRIEDAQRRMGSG
jgi:uncharacterized protein (DUF2336 family)